MGARLKRGSRVGIVLAVVIAGVWSLPARASGACGHEHVSIEGSEAEAARACKALGEVLGYFSSLGLEIAPHVKIVFSRTVVIDSFDAVTGAPRGQMQVSGYFDATHRRLEVSSAESAARPDRRPWRLDWGPAIANSILQHELVHMATSAWVKQSGLRLAKPWVEFIAYAVQFDLMDDALRSRILAGYPGLEPFERPEHVNPIMQAHDPDAFGVQSYLYARANGGREFIRRLLRNEVRFTLDDIFWIR